MRGARCALTCDPARRTFVSAGCSPQAALNGRRRSQCGEGSVAGGRRTVLVLQGGLASRHPPYSLSPERRAYPFTSPSLGVKRASFV